MPTVLACPTYLYSLQPTSGLPSGAQTEPGRECGQGVGTAALQAGQHPHGLTYLRVVAGLLRCQLPGGKQRSQRRVAVSGVELPAGEVDVMVGHAVGGNAGEVVQAASAVAGFGALAQFDGHADRPDCYVRLVDCEPVVVGVGGKVPAGTGRFSQVGAGGGGVVRAAPPRDGALRARTPT